MSVKFCVYTEMKSELLARKNALSAERNSLLKAAHRLAEIDAALADVNVELVRAEECLEKRKTVQAEGYPAD